MSIIIRDSNIASISIMIKYLIIKEENLHMRIVIMKVYLRANWVHSLKEKRMVVKSINAKLKNKFNVSVSEIENQDIHQSIVIGICAIALDSKIADSISENIIDFIEDNCEAEIIDIVKQIEIY